MLVFSAPVLVAIVFFYSMLLGFPLTYWFFKKHGDLGLLDKTVIGFAVGQYLPPFALFLLSFALPVNPPVVIGLSLVMAAGGAFLFARDKCHEQLKGEVAGCVSELRESLGRLSGLSLAPESINGLFSSNGLKVLVSILVFGLMLVTFLTRFQTYSPIYSEIDPYYYIYSTQMLVTQGSIPLTDNTAWYPLVTPTHRVRPVVIYQEAIWYFLYTLFQGISSYNNYLLAMVSSFYPPIAGMLLTYAFYFIFKTLYGRRVGLVAAAVSVAMPILFQKTLAGTFELVPMGMFAVIFSFGAYAYALKDLSDQRRLALAAFAFMLVVLGSNYSMVLEVPLAIYLIAQAAISGLASFRSEIDLRKFAIVNLGFAIAVFAMELLYGFYESGGLSVGTIPMVYLAGALFAGFMALLLVKVPDREYKAYIFLAIALVGISLLLFFPPIKDRLSQFGEDTIGFASYRVPLERTIAEQGVTDQRLDFALGYLGSPLAGTQFAPLSVMEDASSLIFTYGFDTLANSFFNLKVKIHTPPKQGFIMVFILIAALASAYLVLRAIFYKGEHVVVELLVMLFVLLLTYVGVNKIKYSLLLSLTSVLALGVAYFYLEGFVAWLAAAAANALKKWQEALKLVGTAALFLLMLVLTGNQFNSYPISGPLLAHAFDARYSDNPAAFAAKMQNICDVAGDQLACDSLKPYYNENISEQFNSMLCKYSLIKDIFNPQRDELIAGNVKCDFRLSDYWVDTMEWMSKSTEPNARFTGWWDYGHWTNFLGQRDSVLRNEHASLDMIGSIADAYLNGTPAQLKERMLFFNSSYAIFDGELILAGNGLGAKYGALNYLGCAWNNRTNVSFSPGSSECERQHLWENVVVLNSTDAGASPVQLYDFYNNRPIVVYASSKDTCTISQSRNIKGVLGYVLTPAGGALQPTYCLGQVRMANGNIMPGMYSMDGRDAAGDLQVNRGLPGMFSLQETPDGIQLYQTVVFYTEDRIWPGPNGTAVSGLGDAKSQFYTSNLYRAFFLNDLPGFELAYETGDKEVKVYRIKDEGTSAISIPASPAANDLNAPNTISNQDTTNQISSGSNSSGSNGS